MSSYPKITVIINSYNYEQYLRQCIDSVIDQDYINKEIIVVDDGSTDGSPQIVRSYGSAIKSVIHENMGQARACLKAARHATGDYILFLDSDDYLLPGALTAVAAVCSPVVAKVQFQLLPVGPAGEVVGKAWPTMTDRSRPELVKAIEQRGTYLTPPNSGNVHRADLFDYIDDIDYENSIDGIPYLLAPILGDVRQIARPLACYRYHASNFSDHGKLNPDRFALEARRHKARLKHLQAIVDDNGLPALAVHDPDSHSFVYNREILARVSAGRRPGLSLVSRFSWALLRERETFGRALTLWAWAATMQITPDRIRRKLAIYRSDPRSRKF